MTASLKNCGEWQIGSGVEKLVVTCHQELRTFGYFAILFLWGVRFAPPRNPYLLYNQRDASNF